MEANRAEAKPKRNYSVKKRKHGKNKKWSKKQRNYESRSLKVRLDRAQSSSKTPSTSFLKALEDQRRKHAKEAAACKNKTETSSKGRTEGNKPTKLPGYTYCYIRERHFPKGSDHGHGNGLDCTVKRNTRSYQGRLSEDGDVSRVRGCKRKNVLNTPKRKILSLPSLLQCLRERETVHCSYISSKLRKDSIYLAPFTGKSLYVRGLLKGYNPTRSHRLAVSGCGSGHRVICHPYRGGIMFNTLKFNNRQEPLRSKPIGIWNFGRRRLIEQVVFPRETIQSCHKRGYEPVACLTETYDNKCWLHRAQIAYSTKEDGITLNPRLARTHERSCPVKFSTVYGMTFGRKSSIISVATMAKHRGVLSRESEDNYEYAPRYFSDVFSQTFVDADDSILLSGCRNGNLMAWDRRETDYTSRDHRPIFSVSDSSKGIMGSVVWLKALSSSDDKHIIVCNTRTSETQHETLRRFDRRFMREAVVSYSGHATSHRLSNQPDIDCRERIMYAYGTDGVLRQWDIDTGRSLNNISISEVCGRVYGESITKNANTLCFCCGEQDSVNLNVCIVGSDNRNTIALGSNIFSSELPSRFGVLEAISS